MPCRAASDLAVPSYFNVNLVAWLAASKTCWRDNDLISLARVFSVAEHGRGPEEVVSLATQTDCIVSEVFF